MSQESTYDGSDVEQFFKLAESFGLEDLLPEWEISVVEAGDPDTWEHYHPRAATEDNAREKALEEARGIGSEFEDPVVLDVLIGPYAAGWHDKTVEKALRAY